MRCVAPQRARFRIPPSFFDDTRALFRASMSRAAFFDDLFLVDSISEFRST